MERTLILRNVVCQAADVTPTAFRIADFAEPLDFGAGEDKIRMDDLSVTEWEKARLQVLPDRLQLGFLPGADSGLTRLAVAAFFERADELAPGRAVGFNAALGLTLEEGDADPSANLVDAQTLAGSLGGDRARGGFTLVFHDEVSRWWVELSPQPEDDRAWTFDFNRHFSAIPEAGTDDREKVLDWFSDVEASTVSMFETISMGTDR